MVSICLYLMIVSSLGLNSEAEDHRGCGGREGVAEAVERETCASVCPRLLDSNPVRLSAPEMLAASLVISLCTTPQNTRLPLSRLRVDGSIWESRSPCTGERRAIIP